jgi:hypothetical protein
MPRRALGIAIAGAILFQAQARADAAPQAILGLAAFSLPAVCAFITTGRTGGGEEKAEAGEGEAAPGAAAAPAFDRSGWLAGGSASFQFQDFERLGSRSADDSLGMKLRLGYRCSPRLGWEFDYEWAESFDLSPGGDVDLWALTSDAKWYLLTGRWQPFFLTGVGIVTADPLREGTGTDVGGRLGVGIEAYVTENLAVAFDASYVLPTAKVKDLDYLSMTWGFLYRF